MGPVIEKLNWHWVYTWPNLERTVSYNTYIAINLTKCYCFKTCMKLVTTIKDFLNFIMPLNWAAIIGYRLARGTPFYSNDVILLHQVTIPLHQGTVPLFGLHQTQSNDMTQNCISSETHKWYMYESWEIESQNLWFKQLVSRGGVGGQNTLLILASMCFLWNNLWSVCRYAMGCFRGSWRLPEWEGKTAPIHISISNRFDFLMTHFTQI